MAKEKSVIITVGAPGSGKSTWAKDFLARNPGWVRVSRDDFRFMLRNLPMLENKGEKLVTRLIYESARASLLEGFNVIVDNTHCKRAYINEVIEQLNDLASISFELFNTPVEECVARDEAREKKVGESVVRRIHKDYENLIETYTFPHTPRATRLKKDYSKDWDPSLPFVVITDIDGTVAHMNGKRGPFEWHNVGVDDPDQAVINVLKAWKHSGHMVIAVSGRDASCRKETAEWLKKHEVPFDELFMRPAGDYRKDSLIKAEIYENDLKGKYNIVMIYDDRDQVVKTWRKLGLKCAQVEPGEF